MKFRVRDLWAALMHQGPFKRAFRNFFITGNAWGLFSKRSHINKSEKLKVMYNTLKTAQKAADKMGKKHDTHFSAYRCMWCPGYHLGKNRDNKKFNTGP